MPGPKRDAVGPSGVRDVVAGAPPALAEHARADPDRPPVQPVRGRQPRVHRDPILPREPVCADPGDQRHVARHTRLDLAIAAHVPRLPRLLVQLHQR